MYNYHLFIRTQILCKFKKKRAVNESSIAIRVVLLFLLILIVITVMRRSSTFSRGVFMLSKMNNDKWIEITFSTDGNYPLTDHRPHLNIAFAYMVPVPFPYTPAAHVSLSRCQRKKNPGLPTTVIHG